MAGNAALDLPHDGAFAKSRVEVTKESEKIGMLRHQPGTILINFCDLGGVLAGSLVRDITQNVRAGNAQLAAAFDE